MTKKYGSLLNLAAKSINMPLFMTLLSAGASPTESDADGNTPLHYIFSRFDERVNDCFAMTENLIEKLYSISNSSVNINAKNNNSETPLLLSIRKGNRYPILIADNWNRRLNQKKVKYSFFDASIDTGDNILHHLCRTDHLSVIMIVLHQCPALSIQLNEALMIPLDCCSIRKQVAWKLVFDMMKFMAVYLMQNSILIKPKSLDNKRIHFDAGTSTIPKMPQMPFSSSLSQRPSLKGMFNIATDAQRLSLLSTCTPEATASITSFFDVASRYPSIRLKLALLESTVSRLRDIDYPARHARIDHIRAVRLVSRISHILHTVINRVDGRIVYDIRQFMLPSLHRSVCQLRDCLLDRLTVDMCAAVVDLCKVCDRYRDVYDLSITPGVVEMLGKVDRFRIGGVFSTRIVLDYLVPAAY